MELQSLSDFFREIKNISFLKRIFGWASIRSLSYDAYEEFVLLVSRIDSANSEISDLRVKLETSNSENQLLKGDKPELVTLREKLSNLEKDKGQLEKQVASLNQSEVGRKSELERSMATLESLRAQIQSERQKEIDEAKGKEIERLERKKSTWSQHQDRVKETIKSICQKHTIEYVEKPPFKGSPDNTIMIAEEYIIFDAKSPASDENLSNFPAYIRAQAEQAKKYVKEDNVKRDVFLVIPSNTTQVIGEFTHNLADYNAYVVTLDSLEPIILAMKRLEDYEFAEQMSPDDRDNISRVVGKFAHLTKRRVQIDQYFGKQSIELLLKSESELPTEIFEGALDYERSEKLNPPADKRSKGISTPELQKGNAKMEKEADVREISVPQGMQDVIESIPLKKS